MKKLITIIAISLLTGNAFAAVRVGEIRKCKSSSFKVSFKVTKKRLSDNWCYGGSGIFTVVNVIRKGEKSRFSGKWDSCSKRGFRANGGNTEYAVGLTGFGGQSDGAISDKRCDLSEALQCD